MSLLHQLHLSKNKLGRKLFRRLTGPCGTQNRLNREHWLEQNLTQIPAGSRILDAGAGELQYKRFCRHLNYYSQDFAQYHGAGDGIGLQTKKWDQSKLDFVSDINAIPVPDDSFDAVMCIEVLEHLPYPTGALRELYRILKPKGIMIITAPFNSLTHFAPYYYQSGYSRYFYEFWLQKLGLKILDIQWNGNYFEYLAQELRRLPPISEQYALRPLKVLEKLARITLLRGLHRISRNDQGSEQLLAFGIHICAQKIPSEYMR